MQLLHLLHSNQPARLTNRSSKHNHQHHSIQQPLLVCLTVLHTLMQPLPCSTSLPHLEYQMELHTLHLLPLSSKVHQHLVYLLFLHMSHRLLPSTTNLQRLELLECLRFHYNHILVFPLPLPNLTNLNPASSCQHLPVPQLSLEFHFLMRIQYPPPL